MQLAAGAGHTCALLATGKVRCWGRNESGQLGYGNVTKIGDNEPPASAGDVDVGGPVAKITAGEVHTCALLADGNVRCWGWNYHGALGLGNRENVGDNETPASAGNAAIGGTVMDIAAGIGGLHTCVRLTDGHVRCWGMGGSAQLGYGNKNVIGDDETPASAGNVNW